MKICLRRIIRVTLPAVANIKHAEIYHAKKKERENFPIYGTRQPLCYHGLLTCSLLAREGEGRGGMRGRERERRE